MAHDGEYAKRLLRPVWGRIVAGTLARGDASGQHAAVQALPSHRRPQRAQLIALQALVRADLDAWHEGRIAVEVLEEAVAVALAAVAAASVAGAEDWLLAALLIRAGDSLMSRYHLRGDVGDLERQIALAEEALTLTPAGPDRAGRLSNLAVALAGRSHLRGAEAYMERYIALLEEALTLTPAGPNRADRLNNLAAALANRYSLQGEEAELAVAGPGRTPYLNNLAAELHERYRLRGDVGDLERQIALLTAALQDSETLDRPYCAFAVAHALLQQGDAHAPHPDGTAYLDPERLLAALKALKALQKGTEALERMLAAASQEGEGGLLDRHNRLYGLQIEVLLTLAARSAREGDTTTVEEYWLTAYRVAEASKGRRAAALLASQAAEPGADAAPLVARIEPLRRDLARLERDLWVLRRQLTGASDSAPTDDTPRLLGWSGPWLSEPSTDVAPNLVARPSLRPQFFVEALPESAHDLLDDGQQAALRARADEVSVQAAAAWAALRTLYEQVARTDPNYASLGGFAEPRPLVEVAAALPPDGILVLFYPLEDRLALFVLRPGARPDRAPRLMVATVDLPLRTLNETVDAAFGHDGQPRAHGDLEGVLCGLATALIPSLQPLLPAPDPADPPTLVLVPTGPLHRLPLHALPWPDPDGSARLLDGYTMTYTVSADALALVHAKAAAVAGAAALAPGLAESAGGPEPVGTLAAACWVAGTERAALREAADVRALLESGMTAHRRWVLLATHGRASQGAHAEPALLFRDPADPASSEGVWVHAGELLARLPLAGVEHAALAACSTHAEDPTSGDRLAGLLRALQYRGARSVQATLWPVRDDVAALVTMWTYAALMKGGERNKARALRTAVQRLRTCTGGEAADALRELATALPQDDSAHIQMEQYAQAVAAEEMPYTDVAMWAAFVLHGAPLLYHAEPATDIAAT